MGTSSSKANKSSKSHNIFDGAENGTSKASKPGTIPFVANDLDLFGAEVNTDKEDDGSSTKDSSSDINKAQYPPFSAWSETEEDEVTDTSLSGSSISPDDFESNKEIINPNTFSETMADGSGGFPIGGYIGIAAAVVALVGALLWAHKVRSRPKVPVVEEGEQSLFTD